MPLAPDRVASLSVARSFLLPSAGIWGGILSGGGGAAPT